MSDVKHPEIVKRLRIIIDRVTKAVPTEEIILFGSYAYGQPRENSDLDIMVVTSIPGTNTPKWHSHVGTAFYHDVDMPVDLLVYPRDLFDELALFYNPEFKIRNDGIVIYSSRNPRTSHSDK